MPSSINPFSEENEITLATRLDSSVLTPFLQRDCIADKPSKAQFSAIEGFPLNLGSLGIPF